MKFSTKTEYGLRAMTNLAQDYPKIKSLTDIANEENISIKYLEKLIGELRRSNLVESFKGKSGGYILADKPENISIGSIVETLEGPIAFMECESKKCERKQCKPKKLWIKLGTQIRNTLTEMSLRNLID